MTTSNSLDCPNKSGNDYMGNREFTYLILSSSLLFMRGIQRPFCSFSFTKKKTNQKKSPCPGAFDPAKAGLRLPCASQIRRYFGKLLLALSGADSDIPKFLSADFPVLGTGAKGKEDEARSVELRVKKENQMKFG
jgi:hypothetical protein